MGSKKKIFINAIGLLGVFSIVYFSAFYWNLSGVLTEEEVLEKYSNRYGTKVLKGAVLGEEITNENSSEPIEGRPQGDKYRALEMKFGGVATASQDVATGPLEIFDMDSDMYVSKDGKESRMIVVWKTNRPASSSLAYSLTGQLTEKTIDEKSFGYAHGAILTDLSPATAYTYVINCKDQWGNEINSERIGFFAAKESESIFELIAQSFGDVFDWAM